MSQKESITRLNLIVKKLRKHPTDFADILKYLARESELQENNFMVSLRTFQRDLNNIRSLFGIDIQYDASQKVYYIEYDEKSEVSERILEAFDTFNALNITDRLSQYIHFEKRKPQGTENLYGLLHAIKNKLQIKFSYQKYWEEELTNRHVEPYALKEFKNRWYLMAKDLINNKIRTFALDRLTDLEITKTHFLSDNGFQVSEHFKHCFGILGPNADKPQTVVLSFDSFQGKYIKSLPIHESQEIVIDNKKVLQIKLKLFITYDFIMELMSHGSNVKVIEPESLKNELKNNFKKSLKLYK